MRKTASIQHPLFMIVRNDDTVCYFEPELEPKWGGDWQPQVTNDPQKARVQCDLLRAGNPKDKYEIKQLSYHEVIHPGPAWNGGM